MYSAGKTNEDTVLSSKTPMNALLELNKTVLSIYNNLGKKILYSKQRKFEEKSRFIKKSWDINKLLAST